MYTSYHLSIVFYVIAFAFAILFRFMIMFAVGFDCKAIGVKKRKEWMALTFFVPIAAIIYVCIRKNLDKIVPKYCNSCGATSAPGSVVCCNCGSARLVDYAVAGSEKKRKSIWICLIVGLVAYAVSVVMISLGAFWTVQPLAEKYYNNGNGYYDFYDDYDDFEFDDDYDDYFDEYSDYFYQIP